MRHDGILRRVRVTGYDRKKLFVMFLIVMTTLTIDLSISSVADIVSKQAVTFWGIVIFTIIAGIFIVGQFFILYMIKAKNNESKLKSANIIRLEKTVTIVQYVLTAIMVFVVLQIVVTSQYYTHLLTAAVTVSYGLATFLLGLLAYRLFSWFRINESLVVLIYGLAVAAIAINAIDSLVFFDVVLLGKPSMVLPQSQVIFQVGFTPGTPMSIVSLVQSNSLLGYFVLTWGATIVLLHHHIKRVGKVKFWALVIAPLIYFLSYYVSLYQITNPTSPVTTAISSSLMLPILFYAYATNLGGALIGIGFWSISRAISQHSHVRDYMILTAYGFIIYFTAGGATVLQAGYPPFGLANVSFVGLAAFLIYIGLYQSAISVAQDVKLRQSIKNSTIQQSSKLLDRMGTAQMEKQIEDSVMKMTKDNASILADQSGVEPSLTDDEMRSYLDDVVKEIATTKKIYNNLSNVISY